MCDEKKESELLKEQLFMKKPHSYTVMDDGEVKKSR